MTSNLIIIAVICVIVLGAVVSAIGWAIRTQSDDLEVRAPAGWWRRHARGPRP